jgi:hypothetical protein
LLAREPDGEGRAPLEVLNFKIRCS